VQKSIFKNEAEAAEAVAEVIEKVLAGNPYALICICAGHTALPVFEKLVTDAKENKYPSDCFRFISLDEWVGLGIADPGSCVYDVSKNFLDPIGISKGERLFFFDGLSEDLEEECEKAKVFISKNGGLDLILLGVGMNGHIGFNEPGTAASDSIRVVELSEISKLVGKKYFKKEYELYKGVTLGVKEILEAKKVLVMATGTRKQDIVHRTVTGPASEYCPVSLIMGHADIHMYLDEGSARKIL